MDEHEHVATLSEELSDAICDWVNENIGPEIYIHLVFQVGCTEFGEAEAWVVREWYECYSPEAMDAMREIFSRILSSRPRSHLPSAFAVTDCYAWYDKARAIAASFRAPYYGETASRLDEYVRSCWIRHVQDPSEFAPYCTIVQSSGTGKSRLLEQFAVKSCTNTPSHKVDMRAVQVGLHQRSYTPYPWESASVLIVREDELVDDLTVIFEAGMAVWDQTESDHEAFCREIRAALERASSSAAKQNRLGDPRRVLVIAIDDTEDLFETIGDKIRRLSAAFRTINQRYSHMEIFGLLVDNRVAVASGEDPAAPSEKPFDPFVLTQTIDVLYKAARRLGALPIEEWYRVVLMGRPLWWSRRLPYPQLLPFAASKLVGGCDIMKSPSRSAQWQR